MKKNYDKAMSMGKKTLVLEGMAIHAGEWTCIRKAPLITNFLQRKQHCNGAKKGTSSSLGGSTRDRSRKAGNCQGGETILSPERAIVQMEQDKMPK